MRKINLRKRYNIMNEKIEYDDIKIQKDFYNNKTITYSEKINFNTFNRFKVEHYNSKNELESVIFYKNNVKFKMFIFKNNLIQKCTYFGRQERIVQVDYCKDEVLFKRDIYNKINSILESEVFI